MDHLPPTPALSRMRPVFKFKKKRPVSPLRQDRQCPLPQHLPGVDANHQQHPARNRPMGSLLQDRQCPLRQHLPSVDAGHQQSPARNRPMGPLWQDPQQATPASVNSKLSSRLAVFPRPQRIYINKFDRFNGIQGNSSSPGPQLSFVAEKTDGGRVPTGQEVIAIQRGKAPIEAAASYSDHNSTPAQLNDGIIPRGGEAVANNEGNAMSHNETNAPAESADCLLDHNSTPPAELVGEIIPTGGEEGDDVPQNGRGQILAEVEGMSEIIPRGEEGSAMTQDEEGPILAEAIGTTCAHGNIIFSGKIGMWPFVHFVPAARKSQNRARGTIETKSIVVNREVSRQYLIEKVVPAIQAMWPQDDTGRTIFIQQDNARTHVLPNDPAFLEAVEATGMDIKLLQQPPNSPDMNVLDLGFFNSIQSLTDCRSPKTIDELIQGVEEEFEGYDVADLNRVFLSLQMCMVEVMKVGGGNGYKNPHMNKRRLEREGSLPHRLSCDKSLYENVVNYLAQS